MRSSHLKLIWSGLLLAVLASVPLLLPRFANLARAQTAPSALQCMSGGSVVLASAASSAVSVVPAGSTGASTSPAGTQTPIPGLSCVPVSGQVASVFSATATVTTCGVVTAFTAPTSGAAGSVSVNGIALSIPSGSTSPGYLGLGATVVVSFLIPGGQLVEISPGFCAPGGGTVITTKMSGAVEVPPGDPKGSGTATFVFIPSQGMVCFTLSVAGIKLPATAAHIHKAPAGKAGDIVIPLTAPDASGMSSGCVKADSALIGDIVANPANYYVNVHTTDFPAGALRGQLG